MCQHLCFSGGVTDELSHHYRRYRLPELAAKISPKEFTILRQSYFNTFLFLPIAFVRLTMRLLGIKMESDTTTEAGAVNTILYQIFALERKLLLHMNFPFGVSGMLIVRKNKL